MGLSYYYEFMAPAAAQAEQLEAFLQGVAQLAKGLGFRPIEVLNVPFDTTERRDFARRLGGSFTVQDERLKGVALPAEGQVRDHDPISGECRLIPEHGVVLVLTDERGCESCFGFFRYAKAVKDIHGRTLAETGLAGRWNFKDFVDSPDPRFRAIIRQFSEAGFLQRERDEFAGSEDG
jgi:hypothetical protein